MQAARRARREHSLPQLYAVLLRRGLKKWMKSPQNFERLVLGFMNSYDSDQRLILQGFSRSTRFANLCTAPLSKIAYFLETFAKFRWSFEMFTIFIEFCRNFDGFSRDFHGILSELREILENFQKFIKFAANFANFIKIRSKFANFGPKFW